MPFDLGPETTAALAAALLGAAYVRGYSGFGFSAIFIACAALLTNPLPLIPVVFGCEMLMTLFQARGIRPHIDWRRVIALWIGAAVALPFAIPVVLSLGDEAIRATISGIVLVMSLVLLAGWQTKDQIGTPGTLVAGAVSGVINSAGVGGLPVAAFLSAQPIRAASFRATMIVYLTGLDLMTLPYLWAGGLVTRDTGTALILAFPILGLGVWLGTRRFGKASPEGFRRFAISLLLVLAALGLIRAIL